MSFASLVAFSWGTGPVQRRLTWANIACFWNGHTCSAAFPQAFAVLHASECTCYVSVSSSFDNKQSKFVVQTFATSNIKTSVYQRDSGISRQFPCGPKLSSVPLGARPPLPFSLCHFHIFLPLPQTVTTSLLSLSLLSPCFSLLSFFFSFPCFPLSPFFLPVRHDGVTTPGCARA